MHRIRFFLKTVCLWLVLASITTAQPASDSTIKVFYKKKSYLGKPLAWDGQEMMLLRRDGKINILPVKSPKDYQTVKRSFQPYSVDAMRARLQTEFGSKYQVSVTRNFIVVHPPGDYRTWAFPFEELFVRFEAYFSTRGLSLSEPEFPMVAIVLRTRNEFDKFLQAYHTLNRSVLGYYSPKSNRIITYDQSRGQTSSSNWLLNTSTIIHEANHQTAFNTGIHSRYGSVPRWTSEGLAMLFEARGIDNSMHYSRQSERINRKRLLDLQHYYRQGQVKGRVAELVKSDRLFRSSAAQAYAISWGLTFFSERKDAGAISSVFESGCQPS